MTCLPSSNDSFNSDTQLLVSFKNKGYSYVYVLSRNLNLRPWIRSKLWNVGMDRYKVKKNFGMYYCFHWFVFMPEVFAGYLCARLKSKVSSAPNYLFSELLVREFSSIKTIFCMNFLRLLHTQLML